MKGQLIVCANPMCAKEVIKKRHDQKCCGRNACRSIANRIAKGENPYPSFMNGWSGKSKEPTTRSYQKKSNFSGNAARSVLSGAIGPAISSAIGANSFGAKAASAVFTGAVMPLLKEFIKSGNQIRFSSLDDEINKLESDKQYFIKQRNSALQGVLPFKSVGGGIVGSVLGYLLTDKRDKPVNYDELSLRKQRKIDSQIKAQREKAKKNAIIGGIVIGTIGGYMDYTDGRNMSMNAQSIIDTADRELYMIEQELIRLRAEKARVKKWVDEDILVESKDGVYTVNNQILNDIISADEYKTMNIPVTHFKGGFKYILGKSRVKFYKLVGGLPEQGKTSYCVKFATYYSENHGRVLYLPAEQSGKNADFQDVLRKVGGKGFDIETNANQYNLSKLLARVEGYDLVILDSINDMGLSPSDVKAINEKVAVLGVMQSTKSGDFKGGQDYRHDCDKFVVVDRLTASASKSRGTNPNEERERIEIDKIIW